MGKKQHQSLTSATGELSASLTENEDGFEYKEVITDADDEVVAESRFSFCCS